MAILFDWYELPEPKDKQRKKGTSSTHPPERLHHHHRHHRTAPTHSATLLADGNGCLGSAR